MSHGAHAEQEHMTIGQGLAAGMSVGAAIILTLIGALQILQGIAAVAGDELLVAGPEYTFAFDLTTWGWVHIIISIAALVVVLAIAGGIGTLLGGRSRVVAAASGAALLTASALTRFGVLNAGLESVKDPRRVIEPQKARLAARRAAGITDDSITTAG